MEVPLEVYVDNKKVKEWHRYVKGKQLLARVLPKAEWPDELKREISKLVHEDGPTTITEWFDDPIPVLEEPINLYLFETPVSGYVGLKDQIKQMESKKTNMGKFETLLGYTQSEIKAKLEKGMYYDLLATGKFRGERVIAGGGRISTQQGEVPYPMTLDELKMLAVEDLELSIEQARKIEVKVKLTFGWTATSGMTAACFEYGTEKEADEKYTIGSIVQANGVVMYYHGLTRDEVKKFLKIK